MHSEVRHASGGDDPNGAADVLVHLLDELEQRNTQLALGLDELRQFAEVAAHDLRSPLTLVRGYVEQVRRTYAEQLGPRGCGWLDEAIAATHSMGNLIDTILRHSSAAGAPLVMADVRLDDVFTDALRRIAHLVAETKPRIHIEPLPTVRGDHDLLTLVAQNLLSNALKFAVPGGPVVVEVSAEEEAATTVLSGHGSAVVTVRDHGIGIPVEERHRVFAMFSRSSAAAHEGTGIGLATCARIVQRHGGTIWVDAVEGAGTALRIRLPLARPTTSETAG